MAYNLHRVPCRGQVVVEVNRRNTTEELKRKAISLMQKTMTPMIMERYSAWPREAEEAVRALQYDRINLQVHKVRLMTNNAWECRRIPFIGQVEWTLTNKSDDA